MSNNLRVAVFCGFREDKTDPDLPNEILFAYQLLKLFEVGHLDLSPTATPNDKDSSFALQEFSRASNPDSPLWGKFTVFYCNVRPGFLEALRPALEGDRFDYALVVVPKRNCRCGVKNSALRTTPYVPMEFALAEGYGKSPIAFVEQDVPENEIPLITQNVQPKKRFSRSQLEEPSNWPVITAELKDLEKQALTNRRLHFGLPNAPIEEFYLKLCKLLLTATHVSIVNHSLLPLGSTFDEDDTNECVFSVHGHAVSARDLYFELEFALVTENAKRLKCLLTRKPREWTDDFVNSMLDRVGFWARDAGREFVLERAISVPVRFESSDEPSNEAVRQRYLSIFRCLGRIEKRQAEANLAVTAGNRRLQIKYTLRAFPTATLQSFPTTVYMLDDYGTGTAVWGFLRSNQTDTARSDDFLVARNCAMVSVWKKQTEMYFENEAEKHSVNLVEKGGWNVQSSEAACKRLQVMIGNDDLTRDLAQQLRSSFRAPGPGFGKWLQETAK